jgi:hypothetical protein
MITFLLVAGLLVVAVYGVRLIVERSRLFGFGLLGLSVVGIPLVLFPDTSTEIANALGVGRGADLLVYVLFILVLLSFIVLHTALRKHQEELTIVVRTLALESARHESSSGQSD